MGDSLTIVFCWVGKSSKKQLDNVYVFADLHKR